MVLVRILQELINSPQHSALKMRLWAIMSENFAVKVPCCESDRGTVFRFKLLILVVVVWISISSASILVLLSNASAEACAFWRLLLSSLILYALRLRESGNVYFWKIKWYHVIAGFSLAFHFIFWMRSLFIIPVYISTLLVTMYPLYSLLGEILFLHYRPPRVQVIGLVLSVVLLALYLNVENLVLNEGVILALLGGVACSIYFEMGGYARRIIREDTLNYASYTYTLSAIFVFLYAFSQRIELFNYSLKTYVYFALLAIIPMIFGHTLINYILAHYPASLVTMISLGEPFGAGLLAYLVIGQAIELRHVLYGVIIISMVFTTISVTTHRIENR